METTASTLPAGNAPQPASSPAAAELSWAAVLSGVQEQLPVGIYNLLSDESQVSGAFDLDPALPAAGLGVAHRVERPALVEAHPLAGLLVGGDRPGPGHVARGTVLGRLADHPDHPQGLDHLDPQTGHARITPDHLELDRREHPAKNVRKLLIGIAPRHGVALGIAVPAAGGLAAAVEQNIGHRVAVVAARGCQRLVVAQQQQTIIFPAFVQETRYGFT